MAGGRVNIVSKFQVRLKAVGPHRQQLLSL